MWSRDPLFLKWIHQLCSQHLLTFLLPSPFLLLSSQSGYYVPIFPSFKLSYLLHGLVFISWHKYHISKYYSFVMGWYLEREVPSLYSSIFVSITLSFLYSTNFSGSTFEILVRIWLSWFYRLIWCNSASFP